MNQLSKKLGAVAALLSALQFPLACQRASGKNSGEEAPLCVSALEDDFRLRFEEIALEDEPEELTDLKPVPNQPDQLLLVDKQGRLRLYELGENGGVLLDKLQLDTVFGEDDCGAVSLAFDPAYAENHFVYVGHCLSPTASRVTRLTLEEPFEDALATAVTIIELGDDRATRPWHNVGSIGFESDGVMWALFGEKTLRETAQDASVGLGKLLRIVPSREPGLGGFEPAPDGPLVGDSEAAQAAFALGLRSPFRGTRDSRGFYWIGDVGSDLFEEVNVVRSPLDNFGWPAFEGPCEECGETLAPTFYWPRNEVPEYLIEDLQAELTLARVAWAGPEIVESENERYDGRLVGSVLFGDFCAGFLRHGRVDDDGVPRLDAPLGHLNNASAFRQHTDGYVYAITFGRCQTDVDNEADEPFSRLYRMLPADP